MTIQRSTKDMPMLTTTQPKFAPSKFASRDFGRRLSLLVALAVTAIPMAAQAQRKSPLADAPAVRKRFELRQTRLELGAGFASTVNQDFYHTMMVNVKAGFHFTDWLALSAFGDFAVANVATGFRGTLVGSGGSLPDATEPGHYAPTKAEAAAAMQQITNILGAQLEFAPFTGKYSLFGKLFASYDFYLFGGGAGITVKPTNGAGLVDCGSVPAATPVAACKVEGLKFGGTLGVGFHSFFNNFVALDVSFRDVIAKLNPSGRDVDGNSGANDDDLTWTNTWVATLGLVVYFPTRPGVSF
jgi:outer membrane beta-barrel protein